MADDGRVLLRTSERRDYKRCRFRWNLAFNEGWKRYEEKPALRFGDLVHQALAIYYPPGRERGPYPAETFRKLYNEESHRLGDFGVRLDEEWIEAEELGVEMLEHYVEVYGEDPDIEVVAPELPFAIDIYSRDGKRYLVTAVGTFDALYFNRRIGRFGLFEHKTAKSIDAKLKALALDEQAGSYWALASPALREAGYLRSDQEIDHIMYNFLRKAPRDTRPQDEFGHYLNKDGSISKNQPVDYFKRQPVYRDKPDQENLLWRLRAEAWEMSLVRQGKLPVYKNPTDACGFDCPFYDVCELHETGSDWREMLDLAFYRQDPYEAHRPEGTVETAI